MGLFFERPNDRASWSARLAPHVATAATGLGVVADKDPQAFTDAIAASISNTVPPSPGIRTGRLLVAIALFLALAIGGVVAELLKLPTSSNALFGFAGAVFGAVTAFLGAEKGGSA